MRCDQKKTSQNRPGQQVDAKRVLQNGTISPITFQNAETRYKNHSIGEPKAPIA